MTLTFQFELHKKIKLHNIKLKKIKGICQIGILD